MGLFAKVNVLNQIRRREYLNSHTIPAMSRFGRPIHRRKIWLLWARNPRRVKGLSNGLAKLENRSQRWMFDLKRPAYIIADADGLGVTAPASGSKGIGDQGRKQQKSPIQSGASLRGIGSFAIFCRRGIINFGHAPLKGTTQAGNIRLLKVFPKPLDTASDNPRLIRPGEIQAFKFNVTVKGKVGVGIRTESDQLDAKLFDSQFKRLASSPVMIQELELGEYLLTVETIPQASAPIQLHPFGARSYRGAAWRYRRRSSVNI